MGGGGVRVLRDENREVREGIEEDGFKAKTEEGGFTEEDNSGMEDNSRMEDDSGMGDNSGMGDDSGTEGDFGMEDNSDFGTENGSRKEVGIKSPSVPEIRGHTKSSDEGSRTSIVEGLIVSRGSSDSERTPARLLPD